MRVIGSITPTVVMKKEEVIPGGWLSARNEPEERDRFGRQAMANLFGDSASALAYTQRSERLLTSEQLWRVYQRTPDVRSAVDGVARRVSTWDWIVEPAVGYAHNAEARQIAAECTRFLNVPNEDGETWQELIHKIALDQLIYDVGVIEHVFNTIVLPDGTERPGFQLRELTALRGANIHKVLDPHGKLIKYIQDDFIEGGSGLVLDTDSPDAVTFEPRQITFLPLTPNTTTPEAVPLIEAIINEVITMLRSSEHAMLALDADEIPPGILVLTGIAGKAAELAKADLQRMRGKDHKIRVITNADPQANGAKWVELRRSQKDVDFVNVVKEIRRTIWRVFGVMPVEMGATEDVPRSVGQVQLDVSASHLIGPMLEHIENKVNARILPLVAGTPERAKMVHFRFDREAKLTPSEEQDRSQAIGALVDRGILTRNEARRRMGEEPVIGGDVVTLTTGQGVLLLADIANAALNLAVGGNSAMPEPITPQNLNPEPEPRAVGDTDPTNFPKAGDDLKVSLRNSNYRVFDADFAEDLKQNWSRIWRRGGNIRGNDQYRKLKPVVDRGGAIDNATEEGAVRLREAWAARHFRDHRLAGVVALIKWFVIGEIGESEMKKVINDEKDRLRALSKFGVRALPSEWQPDGPFANYRTIDLEELGYLVDGYHDDVDSMWEEANTALVAAILSLWSAGGLTGDRAQQLTQRASQILDQLSNRWAMATYERYREAARLGAENAAELTGQPLDLDYEQAAELYHQEAMSWLTQAGGIMPTVKARLNESISNLTRGEAPIAEFDGDNSAEMATVALLAGLTANRFRIHNWSGKLVMLANEQMTKSIQKMPTVLLADGEIAGPQMTEWYVDWSSVADDRVCTTCRNEAAKPIRALGELVTLPGGDTECGARCRCVLVYWTAEEVRSGLAFKLNL
jgi:hypothetical protein